MGHARTRWEESNEAGLHAFQRGDLIAAEHHFGRAIEEAERADPSGLSAAKSLNNLAETYRAQRRYAEAEGIYRHALAVKEQVLGARHPEVAISLSNLAGLRYVLGDFAGAEHLFKRALAILEATLGANHLEAAKVLGNLAAVSYMQGRCIEAEALYRSALVIRENALGPYHPDVARTLINLATVCRALGRREEADGLLARAAASDTTASPEAQEPTTVLSGRPPKKS